jgi:hypothetical protein
MVSPAPPMEASPILMDYMDCSHPSAPAEGGIFGYCNKLIAFTRLIEALVSLSQAVPRALLFPRRTNQVVIFGFVVTLIALTKPRELRLLFLETATDLEATNLVGSSFSAPCSHSPLQTGLLHLISSLRRLRRPAVLKSDHIFTEEQRKIEKSHTSS